MTKNIVMIGAGEIGLSVGKILSRKSYNVKFWDKDPKVLESLGGDNMSLPELLSEADVVFICVPSWSFREALLFTSPYLPAKATVVSLTKGIDAPTLKIADELLAKYLKRSQPWAILSGMMIAEELREGLPGAAVVASINAKVLRSVSDLFEETGILIVPSADVHGTALCGVLKNIYALAIGLSYGLNLGDNARGILITLAIGEMKKIASLLGGRQESVIGYAGLGDLVATGFSRYSANHEAGSALASGKTAPQSEGIASLSSVVILLGAKYKKFPLLHSLHEIVQGDVEARTAFQKILHG